MSPAASTARPLVASTFRLNESIDTADADRAEEPADRRRNQADEQRDQHGNVQVDCTPLPGREFAVTCESRQRRHCEDKKRGQADEENTERDLVRRLLSLRPFHHCDHAIDKRVSLLAGDA